METTFTPIAMKCTQEQFEVIKPKLEHLNIINIDSFITCGYLTNNLSDTPFYISNINETDNRSYKRTVYEEWNEETFLKACGIETEPTLAEQLEKAEAEVKRLQKAIEDSTIKVGDWVVINETKAIFKVKDNDVKWSIKYSKKITNLELIKLLEQEIK